jgi:hypothetical protein
MAFSYSDPGLSVLDAVRFEIQDTSSKSPLLQNAEIEYAIAQEAPNEPPSECEVLSAAARCMEALARLFSAQADTELGSLKVTYSKQAKGYTERATELRLRAQGMHAPWTGGMSEDEKREREAEPDRVQHAFSRKQFENPYGAGTLPGGVRPGETGET